MGFDVLLNAVPEDESTWWWKRFAVDVPEGSSGQYSIERFTVSQREAMAFQLRQELYGLSHRSVAAGTFTRLVSGDDRSHKIVIMSDTPAEIKDHLELFRAMRGNVLIFGLGIGMAAEAALRDPEVQYVKIVELSSDVITLVGPHLKKRYGEKVSISKANALTYHRHSKDVFDVVWHDIWDTISHKNLAEMKGLEKAWKKRCGWQGCWSKDELTGMSGAGS